MASPVSSSAGDGTLFEAAADQSDINTIMGGSPLIVALRRLGAAAKTMTQVIMALVIMICLVFAI
ncbi:hypothetical protein ACF08O_07710 [Streptomyces paradoxus]|uniref:hypothetical protein n=1 Tax=Streptomyces paradoxus TaxID=66375 RepID=UPI0036F646FC